MSTYDDDTRETEALVTYGGAAGTAALNRSEVECQLAAAHQFRRSIKSFVAEATTLATLSVPVAESCIYAIPRDGKTIAGPSVRLAEIIASAYGNMHVGARIVDVDDREVVAQGVAWDLEKNLRVTVETRRRITGKSGRRFSDDMITVTGNAAASIALRNAIFRVVPRAYVDTVYEQVRKVAVGNAATLSGKRTEVLARLSKLGATQDRVLSRLGKHGVDDIGLEDLELLIALGTAIKTGGTTVDEAFPEPAPQTPSAPGAGTPAAIIAEAQASRSAKRGSKSAAAAPAPVPPVPDADAIEIDPETGEVVPPA